ncbi:MAG: hypothetical protein QOC60_1140 [Frankiaceae bacterium]|nr:hypothetical protein [Frankiaceae bacterium]
MAALYGLRPSGRAAAARPDGSTSDDQEDARQSTHEAVISALDESIRPHDASPWSQYRPCPCSGAGKRPERPGSAARGRQVHHRPAHRILTPRLHWIASGGCAHVSIKVRRGRTSGSASCTTASRRLLAVVAGDADVL